MRNVARESVENLKALFTNAAKKTGLSPAIIEKDFWVCWLLDYLFHRSPWKHNLAFKGGTSLSKAFGLTERFSEDIDLILDWRLLGYHIDEPWEARSNTPNTVVFRYPCSFSDVAILREIRIESGSLAA